VGIVGKYKKRLALAGTRTSKMKKQQTVKFVTIKNCIGVLNKKELNS
jgi:hypothetical protein